MKKILATILALTMVLSLGVSAFAAAGTGGPATGSQNITGSDASSLENNPLGIDVQLTATLPKPTDTYYVTVKWQSMQFVYSGGNAGTWSESSHTYTDATAGTWSGGEQTSQAAATGATSTITVTNHSNVAVKVTGTYDEKSSSGYTSGNEVKGVTVTFTGVTEEELHAGNEENTAGVNDSGANDNVAECTVNVKGTPTEDIEEAVVGTVTITIAAAA